MIKAIPTYYKDIQFRSKMEAEYAKGMDEAGVKFIYEPEGFEFSDGTKYLPDFYLPDYDWFIEVKGVMSDYDKKKIQLFREEIDKVLFIAEGQNIELPTIINDLCICGDVIQSENSDKRFFVENVGFLDEKQKKIFCKKWYVRFYGGETWSFLGENEEGLFMADTDKLSSPFLMKCPICHKLTLHSNEDCWHCGHCGHYDGDNFEKCIFLEELEFPVIRRSYIDYRSKLEEERNAHDEH